VSQVGFREKVAIVGRLVRAFVVNVLWQTILTCALTLLGMYGLIRSLFWAIDHHVSMTVYFSVVASLCTVFLIGLFVSITVWRHGWDHFAAHSPSDKDEPS
jgi:hypothetical protein